MNRKEVKGKAPSQGLFFSDLQNFSDVLILDFKIQTV